MSRNGGKEVLAGRNGESVDQQEHFRKRLGYFRRSKGLTFRRLSKLSGIGVGRLWDLETGYVKQGRVKACPTLDNVVRIARGLGVTPGLLLDEKGVITNSMQANDSLFCKLLQLNDIDRKRIEAIVDLWLREYH